MRPIRRELTRAQVRQRAIQWLQGKGVARIQYGGLDKRRLHFECGCHIVPPHGRAQHRSQASEHWLRRTHICQQHQRALGDGEAL